MFSSTGIPSEGIVGAIGGFVVDRSGGEVCSPNKGIKEIG